jgi:hypothetical protein
VSLRPDARVLLRNTSRASSLPCSTPRRAALPLSSLPRVAPCCPCPRALLPRQPSRTRTSQAAIVSLRCSRRVLRPVTRPRTRALPVLWLCELRLKPSALARYSSDLDILVPDGHAFDDLLAAPLVIGFIFNLLVHPLIPQIVRSSLKSHRRYFFLRHSRTKLYLNHPFRSFSKSCSGAESGSMRSDIGHASPRCAGWFRVPLTPPELAAPGMVVGPAACHGSACKLALVGFVCH